MTSLFAGIYALYNVGGDLKTALTGGLHFEEAPQETDRPYAIYQMLPGRPEYDFDCVFEHVGIQFDIYADSNSTIKDLYTKLTALYDDSRPVATGYSSIIMERKNQIKTRDGDQDQIFRWIVEYEALISKAK